MPFWGEIWTVPYSTFPTENGHIKRLAKYTKQSSLTLQHPFYKKCIWRSATTLLVSFLYFLTWSKFAKELGSWLNPWYCPRNLSPAAIRLNFFKSTTYKAEMWYFLGPKWFLQYPEFQNLQKNVDNKFDNEYSDQIKIKISALNSSNHEKSQLYF